MISLCFPPLKTLKEGTRCTVPTLSNAHYPSMVGARRLTGEAEQPTACRAAEIEVKGAELGMLKGGSCIHAVGILVLVPGMAYCRDYVWMG